MFWRWFSIAWINRLLVLSFSCADCVTSGVSITVDSNNTWCWCMEHPVAATGALSARTRIQRESKCWNTLNESTTVWTTLATCVASLSPVREHWLRITEHAKRKMLMFTKTAVIASEPVRDSHVTSVQRRKNFRPFSVSWTIWWPNMRVMFALFATRDIKHNYCWNNTRSEFTHLHQRLSSVTSATVLHSKV